MAESSDRHFYPYSPLPGPRWTRIVKVRQGAFNDPIQCSIVPIDLDAENHENYIALSYRWGDPDDITTICCDGHTTSITVKLFEAVRRLRNRKSWRTFWADAMSINQAQTDEGLKEKATQVQLMSSIFPKATEVVVDLGQANTETTGLAVGLMRKFAAVPEHDLDGILLRPYFQRYGIPDFKDPAWEAWNDLTRREWFNRVWMVQEFALAKSIKMMIGSYVFDATLLERAALSSRGIEPQFDAIFDSMRRSERSMRGLPIMRLVRQLYKARNTLRLADLFGLCSSFLATDKRDHIFALRGLLRNDRPSDPNDCEDEADPFYVSYKETIPEVAIRFAKYLSKRRPNSLIWIFAGGPQLDQPSWTPRLDVHSLRGVPEGLLPNFEDRTLLFSAGGTDPASYEFLWQASSKPYLRTKGCIVDKIKALTDTFNVDFSDFSITRAEMGEQISSFEPQARQLLVEHGFPNPFTEETGAVFDPYWRSLCSDCYKNGVERIRDPGPFVEQFRAFATVNNMVADGRTQGDIDHDPMQMALVMKMAPFLMDFASTMWKRRVCVTEKGMVGNVPEAAEVGDAVLVILECERPLLMRRKNVEGGAKRWVEFIGNAYIDGIMDGEMLGKEGWKLEDIDVI
jgi:Heterokaryon incompatibility protein (HET)